MKGKTRPSLSCYGTSFSRGPCVKKKRKNWIRWDWNRLRPGTDQIDWSFSTIWIMARLLLSSSVRGRCSDYANVIANVACPTNACKHWISFVTRALMRSLQMLMCVLIMFSFCQYESHDTLQHSSSSLTRVPQGWRYKRFLNKVPRHSSRLKFKCSYALNLLYTVAKRCI
jgi:hypothetical protein